MITNIGVSRIKRISISNHITYMLFTQTVGSAYTYLGLASDIRDLCELDAPDPTRQEL